MKIYNHKSYSLINGHIIYQSLLTFVEVSKGFGIICTNNGIENIKSFPLSLE